MNNATKVPIRKAGDGPLPAAADDGRLDALLGHLGRLLPDPRRADDFRRAMVAPPTTDVRVNRLLPRADAVAAALRTVAEPVPWCADAFALPAALGARIGHCLEYRLGAVYVQAKATTLAVAALDPQPGERVLDLAAAPGGKATQIAAAMANTGVLVANEPRAKRLTALVGNLERCGVHNAIVASTPGSLLARWFHNVFDRVLLDAPCSGDGILCKDRHLLAYWSPEDARRKGLEQIGLLRAAFHMLRPGGRLVYSTCSLSTEENEDVLLGLERRFPGQVEVLPVPRFAGGALAPAVGSSYPGAYARVTRVWPHEHETEGAFVALLGKRGDSAWDRVEGDAGPALAATAADPDPQGMAGVICGQWGFAPPIPDGHELVADARYLLLRPAATARVAACPWFVRGGMRAAGVHKGHVYLSQQAVALWGHAASRRRVELTWPQVQALFAGQAVAGARLPPPGEVVCAHGDWSVCRALVSRDGTRLEGYVPKAARTPQLVRLWT